MNIKRAIIYCALAAIVVGMVLGQFGESLGVPPSWNSYITGGVAGGLGGLIANRKPKGDASGPAEVTKPSDEAPSAPEEADDG